MTPKIDNASYHAGREAFANGASLLSIVERVMRADSLPFYGPDTEEEFNKAISHALGFADALLTQLRHPLVVGTLGVVTDTSHSDRGEA